MPPRARTYTCNCHARPCTMVHLCTLRYRRATGDGLMETAARFRLEHAALLLRETGQPGACIALEAGFCDQSHMNRTFRRLLGRLPSEVRDDRSGFRQTNTGN